jgi:hypothetical protein
VQNSAQLPKGQKTRDEAAEKAGFGNHDTYREAKSIVANVPAHRTPSAVRPSAEPLAPGYGRRVAFIDLVLGIENATPSP